ncbi:MAG: hypothetical protein AB1668_05890 [Nanoarchaeota archaeon]
MKFKMDTKAPLSNGGKCPLCDINFSGNFKANSLNCPKCKQKILLEQAIIYNLIASPSVIPLLKYIPIFWKSYFYTGDEKAIVGVKKKVKLQKSFSNIKDIGVGVPHDPKEKSFERILALATNIKKRSFDLITSGNKKDIQKEIPISYSVHYLDSRYRFPLWCEYLQLGSELMADKDYKTAVIMWASMLDVFYDEILIKKIKGYKTIVKKIDLPTKNQLIEELSNISLNGYKKKLQDLFELRNKIVHGNRKKVSCSKNTCEENLLLILKVMYLCKLSNMSIKEKIRQIENSDVQNVEYILHQLLELAMAVTGRGYVSDDYTKFIEFDIGDITIFSDPYYGNVQIDEQDLNPKEIKDLTAEIKKRLLFFDKKISTMRERAAAEVFGEPLKMFED